MGRADGVNGRIRRVARKGWDPLEEVKRTAAERWVAAVNADGQYGRWKYGIAKRPEEVRQLLADDGGTSSV